MKNRALCVKTIDKAGEIRHYVNIGGVWYYNGRKSLSVICGASDGFWLLSTYGVMHNAQLPSAYLKKLTNFGLHGESVIGQPYIREWESAVGW